MNGKNRVCPVERAGGLDNSFRRWLQNPRKILEPYCKPGMTALDLGCGPGFFSVEMARLVGPTGRVIACDLQEGMLKKLGDKIKGSALEKIIALRQCQDGRIGVSGPVDFVLASTISADSAEAADTASIFASRVPLSQPKWR